jgi:opacity protein-like surface antigen
MESGQRTRRNRACSISQLEGLMQSCRRIGNLIPALLLLLLASPVFAQTDIGVGLYGAFSGTTSGNGVRQSPSNAAGGMFELRHISNPLVGFEATYSYNRANQEYIYTAPVATCPVSGCTLTAVSNNAHEITADWVPSLHIANFRPFGVLGIGLLLNEPTGGQGDTSTSTQAVYVYGAGLDWGLLPHIGLRLQYRGNLYKAPDVSRLYTSTGAFTRTAEPMIGAYFSF